MQDEEELAKIIETFGILSKVRTRSGKALRWTLSNLPHRSPGQPLSSSPVLSNSSQHWVSSDWLPTYQGT